MLLPVLGRGIWRPAIFALPPLALGLAGGGSQLISSSLALNVVGGLSTYADVAHRLGGLLPPRRRPRPPQKEEVR